MGEGGMYDVQWQVRGTGCPKSLWIHVSEWPLQYEQPGSLYDIIIATFHFFKDESGYLQLPEKSPN